MRIDTLSGIRRIIGEWKDNGLTIGLVPTMGYLHEGHASLIRLAAADNDRTVVSVFVNPMQFGPNEDLSDYPRDIERDLMVCRENGAHMVFVPEAGEMYPGGFSSFIDMEGPSAGLCGSKRPGHFRGVCTVVAKLFHIVQPDRAYFGQKDAQQLAVVRRMTDDLNFPVDIVGCPIVREPDGLALSSRNKYLNLEERKAALCLSAGLSFGRELVEAGERSCEAVVNAVRDYILSEPLARVDYVEIVDPKSIQPVQTIDKPVLLAAAAYIGKTRLIDNVIIEA